MSFAYAQDLIIDCIAKVSFAKHAWDLLKILYHFRYDHPSKILSIQFLTTIGRKA